MIPAFVSAVALYGPKSGAAAELLTAVQGLIRDELGDAFRAYAAEQVHGTVVALDAAVHDGQLVSRYFLQNEGTARPMDLRAAQRVLLAGLTPPLTVRFGGWHAGDATPFTSRGLPLHERAFSVQGNAFVLIGWPTATITDPDRRPLDDLRRAMNPSGVLHRYHHRPGDVDNDLYMVIGHHQDAPPVALARVTERVRAHLAAHPADVAIGPDEMRVVAADTHTLSPARFVGRMPVPAADFDRLNS